MTLQQKGIIAGAIVAIFITDGLQIKLIHATPRIPIMMICIWTMLFGISIGQKLHKWKRDKEMASIVAERLLRKPEPPSTETYNSAQNSINAWMQNVSSKNPNIGGILSSLSSYTSGISQGAVGRSLGTSSGLSKIEKEIGIDK